MNILSLQSFAALDDLEVDHFSFIQRLEAITKNRGVVNKYVITGFL